jgi:hypothetical protein
LIVAGAAAGIRVARSRHRRFLHPDGRSFEGELTIWGGDTGAALLDRPATHPVTVRISKGIGTTAGRPDIRGVAVRVHGDEPVDLLLSTCGTGRFTRHLPVPRRSFDTVYGSILAYRTGAGRKIYRGGRANGDVVMLDVGGRPVGRVAMLRPLTAEVDAALAFDPVHNTTADLHPIGLIHRSRALAYPLSQLWRRARPGRDQRKATTTALSAGSSTRSR